MSPRSAKRGSLGSLRAAVLRVQQCWHDVLRLDDSQERTRRLGVSVWPMRSKGVLRGQKLGVSSSLPRLHLSNGDETLVKMFERNIIECPCYP